MVGWIVSPLPSWSPGFPFFTQIVKFIQKKGRLGLAELAAESNKLIDLSSSAAEPDEEEEEEGLKKEGGGEGMEEEEEDKEYKMLISVD